MSEREDGGAAAWDHIDQLLPSAPPDSAWNTGWAPPPPPPPATSAVPVGRRVAAGFIDLVPLVLITFALSHRVEGSASIQYSIAGVRLLAAAGTGFAYYFVSEVLTGTTAGKRLVGLVVVGDDGSRPGAGATALRTLLRAIDGLPVLYLVGFICMIASPDKRRLGDMVAHTRVVRLVPADAATDHRLGRRRGWRTAVSLSLGCIALVAGVLGTVVRASETAPDERLGGYEVGRDMVPFVHQVMSQFEQPTPARVSALFPAGTVPESDAAKLISDVNSKFGTFSGAYTIEDHRKVYGVSFTGLGVHDVMQFKLAAMFSTSQHTVIVTLAAVDGKLMLAHWDVAD